MDKTSKLPPLVAYHRTTAKPFFEFNPEAERSYHSFAGTDGFYFTESPDDLSTMVFGRNKVKANVHINNPAPVETISSNIGDFSFGRINLTKVPGNMDSVRIIKDGKLELATERNGSKKYSKQELNKLAKQGNLFWMIDPEKISKSDAMIMKQYGYDGFVLRDVPGKPDQVVAIDKSQIDIVSFDDGSGEIINPKLQAESK